MVDRKKFAREWDALCARFQREVSRPEMRRYYDWISERLSTEEFLKASRELYARSEFFPRPAAFVEAVRGKPGGPWVQPLPPVVPEVKMLPPGPPEPEMSREERRALREGGRAVIERHLPGWSAWMRRREKRDRTDAKRLDEQRAALKKRMEEGA